MGFLPGLSAPTCHVADITELYTTLEISLGPRAKSPWQPRVSFDSLLVVKFQDGFVPSSASTK